MLRFNALNSVQNKKPLQVAENGKRSELFAINVFNEVAMRQLMTRDAFDAVMNAIQYGTKIDRRVADQVAASMRDWAISKGATHYTQGLGYGERGYPFLTLVPASDRRYCRKTRCFLRTDNTR